jgi:sulfatase maturation enzyme AslB (radical SAM superfamily)
MIKSPATRRTALWAACAFALTFSVASMADDMVNFATAGYASGIRSMPLMHKIDTNGDGMVSKDEWLAFHEKVWAMIDKDNKGSVSAKEFVHSGGAEMNSLATGGFSQGLRTMAVVHKIDTDNDGSVSHAEYIAFQSKVFDMMDTSTTHKGMLGKEQMFGSGGANSH